MRLLDEDRPTEVTEQDRAEFQSHLPYAGLHLNEPSVQEERLILFHLRGMTKAAAGRAAGYRDVDRVYAIFKTDTSTVSVENLDKVPKPEKYKTRFQKPNRGRGVAVQLEGRQ